MNTVDIMDTYEEDNLDMSSDYVQFNLDEELDRKWMIADMLDYEKNKQKYEDFRSKVVDKYILRDDSKAIGYIIEHNGDIICVTFWIFKGDEKFEEKQVNYHSMESLYCDAKLFVESDLTKHSLLHQSKYIMMCDFIKYYDKFILVKI